MVGPSLAIGEDLWLGILPYQHAATRGQARYVLVYRPAPQGDPQWAEHDRWTGPLKLPGGDTMFRMIHGPGGELWITGALGLYRVEPSTVFGWASQRGIGLTTAQWREQYEKRLAGADFGTRFRVLVARKHVATQGHPTASP
jgi:hypothetical protein